MALLNTHPSWQHDANSCTCFFFQYSRFESNLTPEIMRKPRPVFGLVVENMLIMTKSWLVLPSRDRTIVLIAHALFHWLIAGRPSWVRTRTERATQEYNKRFAEPLRNR